MVGGETCQVKRKKRILIDGSSPLSLSLDPQNLDFLPQTFHPITSNLNIQPQLLFGFLKRAGKKAT